MSQITTDSVNAFIQGTKFARGNMQCVVDEHNVKLYQHGNLIAVRPAGRGLYETRISNAGWYSVTTKERLNALLMAITGTWRLCSVKGDWVMWTPTHGEEKPFHGGVTICELVELDVTIQSEREARA